VSEAKRKVKDSSPSTHFVCSGHFFRNGPHWAKSHHKGWLCVEVLRG